MSLAAQLKQMKYNDIIYVLNPAKDIFTLACRDQRLKNKKFGTEVCYTINSKGETREKLTRVQRIK